MKELLVIALVAAMLLLGCAGSAPQQPPAPNGNSNTPPPPPSNQPGGNNNQPPAPPAQNPPAASPMDAFLSALKLSNGWTVTYGVSVDGAAPYTMKEYAKGEDKFRVDTVLEGAETRIYKVGSDMYTCTNTNGWVCYKFSGVVAGEDAATLESNLEKEPSKYTVTADGTMQVAGVTATCYKVVSDGTTTRYCISPEGIPLYISMSGVSGGKQSTTTMAASSYATSVSDSDFTPPAAVQEMPSIPSGGAGADVCSYCSYLTGADKADCLSSCKNQ